MGLAKASRRRDEAEVGYCARSGQERPIVGVLSVFVPVVLQEPVVP